MIIAKLSQPLSSVPATPCTCSEEPCSAPCWLSENGRNHLLFYTYLKGQCLSVRLSVYLSVCPSVRLSVSWYRFSGKDAFCAKWIKQCYISMDREIYAECFRPVKNFQGGFFGPWVAKSVGYPGPRRGAVKGTGRDGALSKGKKNRQTGMGFKLCMAAPLGKRWWKRVKRC